MAAGIPQNFKQLQHYLKTAIEHDKRDPVVAYYCRLYAMQKGMEIDRKSPDGRQFLAGLMNGLEESKNKHKDLEAIQNEIVGQAHLENYALKLFLYADNEDRAGRFGKNVVKSFYTAGMLMDVLSTFGELSEDIEKNRKYAKWKAAYIHNCLKNGETPVSGPLADDGNMDDFGDEFGGTNTELFPDNQWSASQQVHVSPAATPQSQHSHLPQVQPSVQPASFSGAVGGSANLKTEDYTRAMKLCKFATSALQYEDAKTAIENLTKALNLLTTGHE